MSAPHTSIFGGCVVMKKPRPSKADRCTEAGIDDSSDLSIGLSESEISSDRQISSEVPQPQLPQDQPGSRIQPSSELPIELILDILRFVPSGSQRTFHAACMVSRQWYYASIGFLYARPRITSGNYEKFISTVCRKVTNVKPSPLAGLITYLDLSRLVYAGKPSYTARLLRRAKDSLVEFTAPQAQFGYACLVALGNCHKLRTLDLQLVSQAIGMNDFFQQLEKLTGLRSLIFPRSMLHGPDIHAGFKFDLPPKLERFILTGGVSDTVLMQINTPPTLNELHISHLTYARRPSINSFISRVSQQLSVLEVNFHISALPHNAMDKVLILCPNLVRLSVAVDFVTCHLFDEDNTPENHPLVQLDLDSSGVVGADHKLDPNDLYICLAQGQLPHMRVIRVNERLKWMKRNAEDVMDLVSLLEERTAATENTGELVGVWEFISDTMIR